MNHGSAVDVQSVVVGAATSGTVAMNPRQLRAAGSRRSACAMQ
jgi:hypothetical protein